ncbi:hypothetical protein HN682_08155 [Candidatus Peregrinibacteria bacterium]|jgi:hypothetical protein|nr:hypothetical protein [Candidatus Peregrinibacteria bacterium]
MNHIYNQGKKGACVAMAISNGIEEQLGIVVPEEEIYAYFKEHFCDNIDGVRVPVMLQRMKVEPLYGVKVKDYKMLYNSRWRTNPKKKLFMAKVRQALFSKTGALVMVMKIRSKKKGEKKIPLSKEGFLVPRTTRAISHHAMLIVRLAKNHMFSLRQFFVIENSWGKDWAKSGCFYMKAEAIHSEAQSIYHVTFEHATDSAN